jgi:hypothetical protein
MTDLIAPPVEAKWVMGPNGEWYSEQRVRFREGDGQREITVEFTDIISNAIRSGLSVEGALALAELKGEAL